MEHPFGVPLIITNPRAGHGRDRIVARLLAALGERGLRPDVETTTGRGHAEEVARLAVGAGRRYLIAVGGDGTVQEIVNGMVDAETGEVLGDDPVLAVVGAGSGSDLVRTFGLDRAPERLVDHLTSDDVLRIDVGRVRCLGRDGAARTRLFATAAEVGYGARVAELANRLPRHLGAARYVAAIVTSVPTFRRVPTTIEVDGGTTTQPLSNVLVANGQFIGGGMLVAPRALPTDGRFNVQSWGGAPIDVIRALPQLRTGRHLARPDVREWQSASVRVEAARRLPVEADGEPLGTTPATFDVLQQVLALKL